MSNLNAYKLTYTRIGRQESWSGFQVAGKSVDTPDEVSRAFSAAMSAKGAVSGFSKREFVYEIGEFNSNLIISRIRFGLRDLMGRPSIQADGVAFPLNENRDLYRMPEVFLSLSPDSFDNTLKPLYESDAPGAELKRAYQQSSSDILTRYETPVTYNEPFSLAESVEKLFATKAKYRSFVRCMYYLFSSPETVFIKTDAGEAQMTRLMYVLFASLPYSLRNKISCRSFDLPEVERTRLVFSTTVPVGAMYYDLSTGDSNIMSEMFMNNLRRYPFVDYFAARYDSSEGDGYFDRLEEKMEALGDSKSVDLKLIEVAHELLLDDQKGGAGELSDREVLEKLRDFLSLRYNNELIDRRIADLLSTIIERKIPLNDAINDHLKRKLRATSCAALKEVGNTFYAVNMIKSSDRSDDFKRLYRMKESGEGFDVYRAELLSQPGGAAYLDEFYAYSGRHTITNSASLNAFIKETEDLPQKQAVEALKLEKGRELGYHLCDAHLKEGAPIAERFEKYCNYIRITFRDKPGVPNEIIKDVKRWFWNNITIGQFDARCGRDYDKLALSESSGSALFTELCAVFDAIPDCDPGLPKQFASLIRGTEYGLSESEKQTLTKKFRTACADAADKAGDMDFWYWCAALDRASFASYIIENDIDAFIDTSTLKERLKDASFAAEAGRLDMLAGSFENAELTGDDKTIAAEIIRKIREYQREAKKQDRADEKRQREESRSRTEKPGGFFGLFNKKK